MSDGSKISWLDRPGTKPASWNPIRVIAGDKFGVHCEHVSEGCRHCYAESGWNMRFGTKLPFTRQSRDNLSVGVYNKILHQPLSWRASRTIFISSTSDLFGEWVSDAMIDQVLSVIALAPRHTFIILTKRSARMREYFAPAADVLLSRFAFANPPGTMPMTQAEIFVRLSPKATDIQRRQFHATKAIWPLPNLWLGVTAENQEMANKRIPDLLDTPAAVRFVSCEPMLGPVNLTEIRNPEFCPYCMYTDALAGKDVHEDDDYQWTRSERLDWVICGGESGNGARPMHPYWARSLRDQCYTAGVPFFFKQWGEWLPDDQLYHAGFTARRVRSIMINPNGSEYVETLMPKRSATDVSRMLRIGRTASSNQLDGQRLQAWPK